MGTWWKTETRKKQRIRWGDRRTYGTGVRLLLFADCHFAVIEEASDGVVERQELMVEGLPEDVGIVLEAHALLAHGLVGGTAVVADFGAQLGASGLEEVRLLQEAANFIVSEVKDISKGKRRNGVMIQVIDS